MDKSSRKKKFAKEKYNPFRGNRFEGQGFTDDRKRKAIQEYKKLLKKEHKIQGENPVGHRKGPQHGSKQRGEPKFHKPRDKTSAEQGKKKSRFWKQELKFKKAKDAKEERQKEIERAKKQRNEALEKYQQKRKSKHKVLMKKTFRGQPKLGSQIDLLLEKIEASRKT